MSKVIFLVHLFVMISLVTFSQSINDAFSQKKMRKDLEVFRNIRVKANSGLYKYRTKEQIDSIYKWAEKEIEKSSTYGDFYNIICHLTDFEGSLHNDTYLPKKYRKSLPKETYGYFPYPIKWIEGKWIINSINEEIPLGAEIISINNENIQEIIKNTYKYYTTDGTNTTGKRIGITINFSKYYRLNYGLMDSFSVTYLAKDSTIEKRAVLKSIGLIDYYNNVKKRYSNTFDQYDYKDWKENETYTYNKIDKDIGVLRINSFALGNSKSKMHLRYVNFLDSIFASIKKDNLKNLIVDIRHNGGGTDPNDLLTYSFLTQRNFQENKQAWISFNKIPYLKHINSKIPAILRPIGVGKYNKMLREEFYEVKDNRFYQGSLSEDHKIRKPHKNAFKGNIYLLISPRVASAGSMFAAMVAGNENTTVIGEETMGGYYGHNGHVPMEYSLPKSKIKTSFSIVNLEQDVPVKNNQIYNKGIIPDYIVSQSYSDYLNHTDSQMNFTLDLIEKRAGK
ncbi:peptidase [Marinifilum breve]|uniref:Peptidase n=1 Tax=Marinifilum breve TaxID=2184082 RepID=A0A2V4A367_9BACT|nr:S41 family peptidase [Marinifilum breve]PXY02773.1 peptidase [Marinifilum breve]